MRSHRCSPIIMVLFLSISLILVPVVYALPFNENDIGDAGETMATAQTVSVSGSLTSIAGGLSSAADADVYRIQLNGGFFRASTVGTEGTAGETQLFLFDANGVGVRFNDDSISGVRAEINVSSAPAGVYYLAITIIDKDPVDVGGNEIFPDDKTGEHGPLTSNAFVGWNNGGLGYGTYTISILGATGVSQPVVSISSSSSLYEGNSGASDVSLTVSITPTIAEDVIVSYLASDSTAQASDSDYIPSSGSITIPANSSSTTLTLSDLVNGDNKYEPDEPLNVSLTGVTTSNAAVSPTEATSVVTITNDDPLPSISIGDVSQDEGDSGSSTFPFTLSLSNPSYQSITVRGDSSDSTATASDDYGSVSNSPISFAPGDLTAQLNVYVYGDTVVEQNETFFVNLSSADNATIADSQAVSTILNDDTPPNQPPVNSIPSAAQTTLEDTSLIFSSGAGNLISVSDPDAGANPIEVVLSAGNGLLTSGSVTGGTLTGNGTAIVTLNGSITAVNAALNGLSFVPTDNFNGSATLQITSSDLGNTGTGGAQSDTDVISIVVTPVNDPPSFSLLGNPPAVDEDAGEQIITGFAPSISAGAPDESGQTLTFTLNTSGTTGNLTFASAPAIDPLSGDLSYSAAPSANGTATIQVSLSDNGGTENGGSDTATPQTFTITVNAVNDPPKADDLNTSTPEDTTLNGTVTASDIDSNPLTFALDTQAAHGIASVNSDGSFGYVPNVDFVGGDTFIFSVSDGGGSDSATVTINVGGVNDNPVVDAGADQSTDLNTTVNIHATYSDADSSDTHSATIDWGDGSTPENVAAAGGSVSGSHSYSSSGSFTVTITIADSSSGAGSDTLLISVNAPTPTPSATSTPTATSTEVISITFTPTATSSMTATSSISPAPTNTPDAPPPPPAPLAAEVNADPSSSVRVGVPDAMSADIHIRELVVNGEYPTWQGSSITNGGFIGNPGILEMGVLQAVDVFSPGGLSYFEGGIVVCLRGEGTLIYLNARNAPRIAEIVGSYTVPEFPGFTCITLFEPGTLVLVNTVE